MIFNPILPRERIDAMRAGGFWPDRLITEYVDQAAESCPDQVAVTGANSMTGRVTTLSYRQLRRMGNRMALGLVALGVESGDVVSFQLPNWWQVSALYLACTRIGAVINPLMPIFRHREMEFMLGFGETKVLLIPHYFRGFSYPRMMNALRSKLPALEHVLVIGGEDGEDGQSFEAALAEGMLYVPGEYCYPNEGAPRAKNTMRLSFGVQSCENIRRGIAALTRAIKSV